MIRIIEKNGKFRVEQFFPPYDTNWCCIKVCDTKEEAEKFVNSLG